jgi:hypothetical protein
MRSGKQINERKRAMQLRHLEALRSYVEAGEPCDMTYDPPLHVVNDGTSTLTIEIDRETLLRFLPLDF